MVSRSLLATGNEVQTARPNVKSTSKRAPRAVPFMLMDRHDHGVREQLASDFRDRE